jgi:signal transduction histidine kinase
MTTGSLNTEASTDPAEERSLVAALSVSEKVLLLTGADSWRTQGARALGLRPMITSDGPAGVRGVIKDERSPSSSLPCPSALGATWDTGLVHELASALERAREATRMKNRFLANMSHEIRTPMNGVLGMLDLLLGTQMPAEPRGYAEQARQSGNALLALLNDVLDLSNIESGTLKIERAPFGLAAELEEIGSLFALRARAQGLRFSSVIPPEIPARVVGDRWLALDLAGTTAASRLSLVAFSPRHAVSGAGVAGLMVDDWVEVLPAAQQITGLSFHYDDPTARALFREIASLTGGADGIGAAVVTASLRR